MPKVKETQWDLLVSGEELAKIAKEKAKSQLECSVLNKELTEYLSKGWAVKKQGKTKSTVVKEKPIGDAFEDQIWTILYKMGFKIMNKTNDFAVVYDENHGLSKQVDVVAIDDEICLIIECKEAEKEGTSKNWEKDLTEIDSLKSKIFSKIKEKYPDRTFKYLFATKNYTVGEQDKNRMVSFKIPYLNDNAVLYYEKLVDYLGTAAKYQLLGSILAGTEVKGMDNIVPAIRGFMGNKTYYAFLIEPEKLLKIGYVLHRTNANNDYEELLPSYQRLIKKDRLKSVRNFVNDGGYFPNSIIISVDSKKGMQFDVAGKNGGADPLAKMGMLHLPKTYRSAYIIDGQHRLYGYSDSKYAEKNSIPVVAFDNLDKDSQLKLFMEINENQKAVSKGLRNLLEIDMHYTSLDPNKRQKALFGNIAKRLGEDPKSPLYGRVIIGEDAQTEKCCITIDYIKSGLNKTDFFNEYKKNGSVAKSGLFEKESNDKTMDAVYPLLLKYLSDIRENCADEWNNDGSYITKNNAIPALIQLFGDTVDIVLSKSPEVKKDINRLYDECQIFVLALCEVINTLPAELRKQIVEARGEKAKSASYRTLQMELYKSYPDFCNDDIENYYNNFYIDYSVETKNDINIIKNTIKEYMKSVFTEEDWTNKHLDEKHDADFASRIGAKQSLNKRNGIDEKIDLWEELTFTDFDKIINYGTQWTNYFKTFFERHGVETKVKASMFLKTLSSTEDNIHNGKRIPKTVYDTIHVFNEFVDDATNC